MTKLSDNDVASIYGGNTISSCESTCPLGNVTESESSYCCRHTSDCFSQFVFTCGATRCGIGCRMGGLYVSFSLNASGSCGPGEMVGFEYGGPFMLIERSCS